MRAGWYFVAIVTLLIVSGEKREARASSPVEYCQQIGTDDALRAIPASLVPDAVRLFQLDAMPAKQVQQSTYFRCANHHVLVCNTGANLPCGKADTRRDLPGADGWCARHAGSDFISMYVIGHATIYRWRCDGPKAAINGTASDMDERGFIAQDWKQVGPD
jgi:hypothetical protein